MQCPFTDLFTTKKKDKGRPRFSPDTSGLRGALSWRVVAEDCSTRHEVRKILIDKLFFKGFLGSEISVFSVDIGID